MNVRVKSSSGYIIIGILLIGFITGLLLSVIPFNIRNIVIILSGIAIINIIYFFINMRSLAIIKKLEKFREYFSNAALGDLTARYPVREVCCSREMECGNEECEDFGNEAVLCWFDVGSYAPKFGKEIQCPKILNGVYNSCIKCKKVYRYVCFDEVETLGAWFNKFAEQFQNVIIFSQELTGKLASASNEATDAMDQVSMNAQNQAASVEEVTASIEEISTGMDSITFNTEEQFEKIEFLLADIDKLNKINVDMSEKIEATTSLTNKISEKVKSGESILQNMNISMQQITESSKQVVNIIDMINGISDKINLLSLNAAIEAARAGESGRGFAVVADEISKLADVTSSSIKDIESLIRKNNEGINSGMSHVDTMVENISKIVSGISNVTELINEINRSMKEQVNSNNDVHNSTSVVRKRSEENKASLSEQKTAMTEITSSITNINQAIQSNTAEYEQIASGVASLAQMAENIVSIIDRYNIK